MKSWMRTNTGVSENNVFEMDWWEERKLSNSDVKIVFTPANHWCKRSVSDDNTVLWGSWSVIGPNNSFWFGGDTAYSEAFKQIGEKYGPFSMAAIPIGAYQPNWFMKYQHVHPGEAVEIHKDVKSQKSLGIHWGTFKLTVENYLEPPKLLDTYLNNNNIPTDDFVTVNIGGSVEP
ncbi:N-acyl-phosphatidylethanolamine-hydrolyzing phospholipase D [Eurytemora carolleeae]|uniref:N-acyl-phosphatidylethanolamine-hydrolyzing phospholipase D n=1 Tax=Eurytemora carolleeae TaxID=1294199 RepID=UPI000C787006|nr:N-acyl-phosphatidylethanolamine-hydrolyzing phospholipase D [Eurytemora carolleeae]|eukprot:XP_023323041.1 N-acyl-phosphatidylethanolamine-hydrolyzing phospholipase D-like [Eurytemora affinis]